ncbi:YnbE family lipoprotein [Sphingomonas sp. RB1R13]|uniref:YnbE family lipoprotein n=1 Tax=Sphingomonas sp. RB1R13 TaxID=3096159 RepID=UPI002FC8D895
MAGLKARLALGVAALLPLGGCISVKTPEKPIEINLNVDIKQEVAVKLQRDVDALIKSNPEAFPKAAPSTLGKKPAQ